MPPYSVWASKQVPMRLLSRRLAKILAVIAIVGMCAGSMSGYSVLTHEQVVDLIWKDQIQPRLLKRFPKASSEDLQKAHAYAYGGCVVQDMGYYPFGSKFFSDLVHYVRSGDFVEALIHDAHGLDEYSFAIGALAHYANDNAGHPEAVNRAVPLVFPKLRAKFGDRVTYVQAPKQHVIVEFSFDIIQAAGGAYVPDAYRRFIGFRVASPLLERAFRETYGLEMTDVFASQDRAIATYRYAVSELIPALTKAAWRDKHDEIAKLMPSVSQSSFVFAYSHPAFEHDYGSEYEKPGFFARVLAWLYRLVPKIGPLKPLSFKAPTPEAEAMFAQSFRDAGVRLRSLLTSVPDGRIELPNTNFDTGAAGRHGDYALADDTYAELLARLAERQFEGASTALTRNILAFYGPK